MLLGATYRRRCDDETQLAEDMARFVVRKVRQGKEWVLFMDVELFSFWNALACDGSSVQYTICTPGGGGDQRVQGSAARVTCRAANARLAVR